MGKLGAGDGREAGVVDGGGDGVVDEGLPGWFGIDGENITDAATELVGVGAKGDEGALGLV